MKVRVETSNTLVKTPKLSFPNSTCCWHFRSLHKETNCRHSDRAQEKFTWSFVEMSVVKTMRSVNEAGESEDRAVWLPMSSEPHHYNHHAKSNRRRRIANGTLASDGILGKSEINEYCERSETISSFIDIVTHEWIVLSNGETHSFTLPLSASSSGNSTSSISTSPFPCASVRHKDCRHGPCVFEEETIKPLGANLGECNDSQQHQCSSPPHESKSLVLTHDQRKMKRRRMAKQTSLIAVIRDTIRPSLIRNSSFSSSSLLFGLILIITSLIHSSHQQSFFSPSSDEWDGGSFRTGTYGNGYTCVNTPVNFTLCKNIGYTKMMIPNLLGHDSLQEAEFHAKSWVPLLGLQCHPDTQLFLCSLFSPICLDRPIYPCRSLCQGVQAKCEPRMLAYNYPWPSMLKCDQFPEDHDLCIRPGAANKSDGDPEMECPSCNQAHTCENIVDNFCRADFVFRAKHKKSKGPLVEFRKERWFKPKEGNRRGRELRALSLDSKDDCCATKLRPGFPYIVMGVKRGDEYIITFAMQWNPKDRILKNAVRTFRSMDCRNPLPMSVTAAGGGRNATNNGGGRRRRRKQGRRNRQQQYGGCRVSTPGKNN